MRSIHTKELDIARIKEKLELLQSYDPRTAMLHDRLLSNLMKRGMRTNLAEDMLDKELEGLDKVIAYVPTPTR